MSDWLPRVKRDGPGRYRVVCGEEVVPVWKDGRDWVTRTKEGGFSFLHAHASKADAVEYAIEWLQENA